MKYLCFILSIMWLVSCDEESYKTNYLTNNEKAFIPYQLNDSIAMTYTNDSTNVIEYDTIAVCNYYINIERQESGLEISISEHYYEKKGLTIGKEKGDAPIVLIIDKEYDSFNVKFYAFDEFFYEEITPEYGLRFVYEDFETNTKKVEYRDNILLDKIEYQNVYIMEDLGNEDTYFLYYSPNYGLIKLVTDVGTYTFKNLN